MEDDRGYRGFSSRAWIDVSIYQNIDCCGGHDNRWFGGFLVNIRITVLGLFTEKHVSGKNRRALWLLGRRKRQKWARFLVGFTTLGNIHLGKSDANRSTGSR